VTLEAIRAHYESYQEARRILASDFASVQERKAAICVRDEFMAIAPRYVSQLLCGAEMIGMALDNYFSYSPSRRDEKALGPVETARKALGVAISPSREWCERAAQSEADNGDPDCTAGVA
jgi:hypothetical protein